MTTATLRPPASAQARYTGLDRMLVNGTWQTGRGAETLDDRDPYTGKTLLNIPLADQRDLDDAFSSAAAAQPGWWDELPRERATVIRRAAEIMEERRDELVEWLIRESGSTRIKANIECDLTQAITMEAATFPSRMEGPIPASDVPGKENHVYRQPVGVVGMISPWNFPLHLSCRSVAPALALGNAVVLKPSSDTPVTGGTLIAKIYEEAGLPAGLLNVVVGRGNEMGDAFVRHPGPRVISFTGSTKVGRRIAELCATGSILKRAVLELGGNSPCVILDDADIDLAVQIAVFGKFLHQGQICMATNRLIVDAKIYDQFVDRFVARVRSLKVGDPSDSDTVIGPVINNQQLAQHLKHIDQARQEGAREVAGGKPQGLVLPPHVFVDVTKDMSLARDELFGPIVGVIKVRSEDEALEVANDTDYGLSSAVVTRDVERGEQFARRIQAGMTHVNDSPVNDLPTCPFGGEKNSGMGRYNGHWAIDEFTTVHWISVQHEPLQYPF